MIGNIENPKLYNKVHSYDEEFFNKTMLLVFNHLMCNSPKWSDTRVLPFGIIHLLHTQNFPKN